MIHFLRRLFTPRFLLSEPSFQGHLRIETREGGKLRQVSEGHNIWTLTGREFVVESLGLEDNVPRTPFREDRILHIGLGVGSQPEVSSITSLVDPVPYVAGEYLAYLATPATFPTAGTTNTIARFTREFGKTELSLGYNVILTEAGLFTDGDPDTNWVVPAPTDFTTSSGRAPMAYKTFEPVTKTTSFTVRVTWDVRVL